MLVEVTAMGRADGGAHAPRPGVDAWPDGRGRSSGGRTPGVPARARGVVRVRHPAGGRLERARRARACALALVGALLLPGAMHAQVPPAAHWRTLRTTHFRVSYTPGLDSLARHTGAAAERAYAALARDLPPPPDGTIDLVLGDNVDFSNGVTSLFPGNHIVLYARPPVGDIDLVRYPDWMEILLDHEVTHTFHLDRTSAFGRVVRRVFGRLPYGWPFFPVAGTPGWSLEGMAVFQESHLSGAGRIYGSYHDMVLRAATLEDGGTRFFGLDRLTGESPIWPGADAAYIYGSFFLEHLAERFGPDVERRIAQATARQRIPSFARVLPAAIGESWPRAYGDWRAALRARYEGVAGDVAARGPTRTETLTRAGYYALHPRVSADGGSVAFAALDPRSAAETRTWDAATGRVQRWARRNSLEPASWLPDGRLLTTQLDRRGRYHVYDDLYAVSADGHESRLTRGARLEQADARRRDGAVVAVQDSAGMTRLVRLDPDGRDLRALTPFDADHYWATPRWSPEGQRVAAARWSRGGAWDIVVLDTAGAAIAPLTHDHAENTGPAWTPDGRLVLWASDRTGIPNIFARDVRGDSTWQVTNVLGGAFWPDVSPDGRWLYFSGYHADGWHLERTMLDRARWLPAERIAASPQGVETLPPNPALPTTDTLAGSSQAYSPLPTLRPRFWLPVAYRQAGGTFLGAVTGGEDVVQRHSYAVLAAYDPRHRRPAWQAAYAFAGLGDPVLGLLASRSWDDFTAVSGTNRYPGIRRDDDYAASATFLAPRLRRTVAVTVGADLAQRYWSLPGAPAGVRLAAPSDRLGGPFGTIAFANYQVHPYSFSREDGLSAFVSGRRRWAAGFAPGHDRTYSEASGAVFGYRALRLPGFANHVLAARVTGLWRAGPGAEPEDIGGVSGQTLSIGPVSAGTPGTFLPVRGYAEGDRSGTRAWSASLEYRLPLALVDRGWATNPYYLHQLSADAFVDAGNASCPVVDANGATPNGFACSRPRLRPLVGAGAELVADGRVLFPSTLRFRAGIGFPTTQPGPVRSWLTLGSSF